MRNNALLVTLYDSDRYETRCHYDATTNTVLSVEEWSVEQKAIFASAGGYSRESQWVLLPTGEMIGTFTYADGINECLDVVTDCIPMYVSD